MPPIVDERYYFGFFPGWILLECNNDFHIFAYAVSFHCVDVRRGCLSCFPRFLFNVCFVCNVKKFEPFVEKNYSLTYRIKNACR